MWQGNNGVKNKCCSTKRFSFEKYEKRLSSTKTNIADNLRLQHELSNVFPLLSGMLFSPRSDTKLDDQKNYSLRICSVCLDSLRKPNELAKPHKFAIANGFYIGQLPENLIDATLPELWLTSLASIRPPVHTIQGWKHQVLRFHATVFSSNPCDILQKVEKLAEEDFKFLVITRSKLANEQTKKYIDNI